MSVWKADESWIRLRINQMKSVGEMLKEYPGLIQIGPGLYVSKHSVEQIASKEAEKESHHDSKEPRLPDHEVPTA